MKPTIVTTLPSLLTQITLKGPAIEAKICLALNWCEEKLAFYSENTHLIPLSDARKINRIIRTELRKLSRKPPQLPLPSFQRPLKHALSNKTSIRSSNKLICNGNYMLNQSTHQLL